MKIVLSSGKTVSVEIKRTKRKKTVSLSIEGGQVCLVIPRKLTQQKIDEILKKKIRWIEKKLYENGLHKLPSAKTYVDGEIFTYFGKNYRLSCKEGEQVGVRLKGGELRSVVQRGLPDVDQTQTHREQIEDWYEQHAFEVLKKRTLMHAEALKVHPKSLKVKNYKARWGSCSAKGDIRYNWKIVIAPRKIVDYVIFHELSHLFYHDHSEHFWRQVAKYVPDYRESRSWLKKNGPGLVL